MRYTYSALDPLVQIGSVAAPVDMMSIFFHDESQITDHTHFMLLKLSVRVNKIDKKPSMSYKCESLCSSGCGGILTH